MTANIYLVADLDATCERVGIKPTDILRVAYAWGEGDWGHEWSGGFIFQMRDETWRAVWGWCDYTGWGCQDGAFVSTFDRWQPDDTELPKKFRALAECDKDPADLNAWLAAGAPDNYSWKWERGAEGAANRT